MRDGTVRTVIMIMGAALTLLAFGMAALRLYQDAKEGQATLGPRPQGPIKDADPERAGWQRPEGLGPSSRYE